MENAQESKTTSSPCSPSVTIKRALLELALMRGSTPAAEVIKRYTDRLVKEHLADVVGALQMIQDLPRREGELAFPEIGTLLAATEMMRVSRFNREKSDREYYQQQVCPGCGSIVGMMRPRGEQFRTWCVVCEKYRKIIPEDETLTGPEWELLCVELEAIFREWKRRGSKYKECVDPQFDREQVRGRVA